jgi:hypothetical protein
LRTEAAGYPLETPRSSSLRSMATALRYFGTGSANAYHGPSYRWGRMMNLYGTRYDEITSARSTLPSRLQDRPEGEDKAERQGQHRMGRSLAGGPLAVRSGHRIFATSRLKLIRCRSPNNLDCGNNSKVNNSAPYNRVRQLGGHPASSVRVYQHAQILFSSAFERPLFGGPARPSISESKRGVRARSSPNACRSSKGRRADGQHPSCY